MLFNSHLNKPQKPTSPPNFFPTCDWGGKGDRDFITLSKWESVLASAAHILSENLSVGLLTLSLPSWWFQMVPSNSECKIGWWSSEQSGLQVERHLCLLELFCEL